MEFIDINEKNKDEYNTVVSHPLQSYEWGEFRKKTGVKVIRKGLVKNGKIIDGFTLTIHKVPYISYNIGYLPKGKLPDKQLLDELHKIGKQENCIYIQLEPDVIIDQKSSANRRINQNLNQNSKLNLQNSFHPLFTKYTFILDIDKPEEVLLKNMHPKTRYNIKVAQKHNVKIDENISDEAFEEYMILTRETTTRQKFYAHTEKYHRLMWETLQCQKTKDQRLKTNDLIAHLFTATYKPNEAEKLQTLVSWILFTFHDTLYYPYGASSSEYRNVMASNLIMWEAIKFGKKLGLKKLDMWGALGPEPDTKDPWYGFHKFKQGYGAQLTEFIGSYDLVINPILYKGMKAADKLRWLYLRMKK